MEAVDATGRYWFPGSEGLAVYGRLVFDPADGTTLTLADRPQHPIARYLAALTYGRRHVDEPERPAPQ